MQEGSTSLSKMGLTEMDVIFIFLSFTFILISTSLGNPVIAGDFNDAWDYKLTPHHSPILNKTIVNHHLPAAPRQPKEEEEDEDPLQHLGAAIHHKGDKVEEGDVVRSFIPCSVCKLIAGLLQNDVKGDVSEVIVEGKFVSLCVAFKIQIEPVCKGLFNAYFPVVRPALKLTNMSPNQICSMWLGEGCDEINIPEHEWEIQLSDIPKPEIKLPLPPKEGNPNLKVLQISDTHFDRHYAEGGVANCQEPLCCRTFSTPNENEKPVPAGKWGYYKKCDAPKGLIDNMYQNIANTHKDIDYIIWTGDVVPHDIWNQTKEDVLYILEESVKQVQNNFPGIPVFPALGNHEGIPSGNFPPLWVQDKDHSIQWLYNEVAKQWAKFLPESVQPTILHGGFYSVLVRPGFRVIGLNTNYCHTISWWLLVNSTDPAKELKWLVYELQEAEDKGEKVHIIGHIAPGASDCLKVWSNNYYKIVDRYENTITAQFYGHSHGDEFEVFYDAKDLKRPNNIAYLGPSVTTYENYNPAYRLYYVDGEHNETTWEVMDHETWMLDIEEANNKYESNPEWFKLYSAREAYGMRSLRPKDWDNFIKKMVGNTNLFEQYHRHYYRESPVRPEYSDKDKLLMLCDLRCAKAQSRRTLCNDLEVIFRKG